MRASILHVDLDAFYASVEERRNPALHGKAFAVGGGVVLSASYEARRYGVRSGMGARRARELCPQIIIVKGTFEDYRSASDDVFEICRRFTPVIEQMSIDEAFLDVSGSEHLFGPAEQIAHDLKALTLTETRLTVSIGVARSKFLAKIASKVAKPDGIVVVPPDREREFLDPLPVDAIWGIGAATKERLARYGVESVADLAAMPRATLAGWFGPYLGPHLQDLAVARDARQVKTTHRARSVGSQSAFGGDVHDRARWDRILLGVADRVSRRLREKDRSAATITTRVRFSDMQSVTRARTLSAPIATTDGLFAVARGLMLTAVSEASEGRGLSLLGIRTTKLRVAAPQQLEFDLGLGDTLIRPGTAASIQRYDLDRAVDELREKFGSKSVGRASVMLGGDGWVPDEFRELAQARETG